MMAELPAEQIDESGETQTALLTNFLTNTYHLVDDCEVDDLISWNEDGTSFIIWKPAEFARDLLPRKLKHDDLSTFFRQLSTCGFRKVVPDRLEFANDFFKRGEIGLLRNIQGRTLSAANVSTAEGPSSYSSVPKPVVLEEHVLLSPSFSTGGNVDGSSKSRSPEMRNENRRLEKENQEMTDELSHLKGLCNNIFSMMSNYESSGEQDSKNVSMESRQLNLLQSGKHPDEHEGSSGGGACAMDYKEEDGSPMSKRIKRNDEDEERPNDAQTESYGYSNTGRSERKKEPGPGPS